MSFHILLDFCISQFHFIFEPLHNQSPSRLVSSKWYGDKQGREVTAADDITDTYYLHAFWKINVLCFSNNCHLFNYFFNKVKMKQMNDSFPYWALSSLL